MKNTIIRFPEQMSMERALNQNMDWTIRQLQTLTRMCNSQNNGLLCVSLGLGLMAILWKMTNDEVDKLQEKNRHISKALHCMQEEIEILKTQMIEEGRKQM